MNLKSKIRLRSLINFAVLGLFFTLPMVGIAFIGFLPKEASNTPTNALAICVVSFFTVPIGLMPLHLLLDGFLFVQFTETEIILVKYFGFWQKRYFYSDLKSYSTSSYARSKGSSKRYAVFNVLFSDGKAFRIDEGNIANFQEISQKMLKEGSLVEDKKVIHDDNGLYIWLFYVITAFVGTGIMLLILKFVK